MRGEIPRGETWLTTPGQMRRGARRQRLIFGPCPTKAGPMMNIAIMARNVVGASLLLATAAALGGCDAAPAPDSRPPLEGARSEEHTSELQSLMRISYAVFCLKKKTNKHTQHH